MLEKLFCVLVLFFFCDNILLHKKPGTHVSLLFSYLNYSNDSARKNKKKKLNSASFSFRFFNIWR